MLGNVRTTFYNPSYIAELFFILCETNNLVHVLLIMQFRVTLKNHALNAQYITLQQIGLHKWH